MSWPPDPLTIGIVSFFIVLFLLGLGLRDFKNQHLVPLIGRLPIHANVLTGLRPVLICLSMYCFRHQFPLGYILTLYVIGWSTDYFDGLKARAEQARVRRLVSSRNYRPPVFGQYLDPIADMIAITIMTVSCWSYYPFVVILGFSGAIIARTILFGILLYNRRHKLTWRLRFTSDILPKTISGEMKAGIIAMSFFLVIGWPDHAGAVAWASRLLVLSIIVEAVTLSSLVRTAVRMARLKAVEPLQKTGTN